MEGESETIEKRERWVKVKPDGGWGWVIVIGVAIKNMFTISLVSVSGLLFMQRLPELGIDASGFSFMVSLQMMISNFSGLVTGPLLKYYSPRQLALTGSTFVVTGLILTGYANSLPTFILSYSILVGLGKGFISPATFFSINSYFVTWRARAVGITRTGVSIGQMVKPMVVQYLLTEFGFRGTLLIISGMSAQSFIGAVLLQPVEQHMKRKRVTQEEVKMKVDKGDAPEDKEESKECEPLRNASPKDAPKKNFFWMIFGSMNWRLLKNLSFLNVLIWLGIIFTANITFRMFFPFYLESVGYTREMIAICMTVRSGADFLGRLLIPSFVDIFKWKSKTALFLGAGLSALTRTSIVLCGQATNELYPMLAISVACGIVRSAISCNFNLCVADECSPDDLPSALGLFMVFKGLSVLLLAPLTGYIRDFTGDYAVSIHVITFFFLFLPFTIWLIESVCLRRRPRRRPN